MEFLLNFSSWYKTLPASGKLSLLLVVVGAVVAGFLITAQTKFSGYQYLYTNLSLTDQNKIAERLQGMNVEAQFRGDSILVPGHKVLELRNTLSAEGLPQGGGVGFELFDKQNFGETEFQQRINYMRATQGEIARTIMAIDGVEKARVHIVVPEQSLFAVDQRQPSASVALNMAKGRKLSDGQVKGILHLIVTSVEGLTESNVSIIDQNGNILFQGSKDSSSIMSAKGMEIQASVEGRLESQVRDLLERIVGSNGISVKVSANLNLQQIERTVEQIDPESRVALAENTTTEQSTGSTGSSGGVPGSASNLPGGGASGSGASSESSKRIETTATYVVSKTTQKILEPVGTIKSLSVAVLVDGKYTAKEDGTQDYAPRTDDELKKIEDLVKKAVGFDEARGDKVKVENMQFKQIEITDVPQDQFVNASTSNQWKMFMLDHGKTVALALILGIIFLMLVRIVNSYAPPIEVAYANIIGQQAGRIAEALPAAGAVQIVKRNDAAVSEKQEQIAKQLPEVQRRQGGEINFVETAPSITIETPVTSEEKLRLKAAKIQTEELIKQNSNDAVKVIRSWMSEG
jgi:flagellar M-ring protein FliF